MAGKVANIKVSSPLKPHHGLIGKCHVICHYSYNLPLCASEKNASMKNKQLANYLLKVILVSIALIPLIYYNQIEEVPIKTFVLGTGSWGIGLIFKMISHQLIVVPLQSKNQPILLISTITDLSANKLLNHLNRLQSL
jgi:hypothetical protein